MIEFKGTPGPWSMSSPPYDSIPWHHMYGPDGKHIMHMDRPDDEKIASTFLIAAATELLAALQPFADCVEQIDEKESDEEWAKFRLLIGDYRRARAAIAKALGQ